MDKVFVKKMVNNYLSYRYHKEQKHVANRILKSIESVKGKTDPKLIKLSNDYACDVLGWSGFSPWLNVYCAVNQNFKEGWIPDNYYDKVVVPALKGDYGKVSELKSFTNKIFKSDFFPDRIYYVNGLWFSNDYQIISDEKIKEIIFKKSKKVVFKIDNSFQGKGVFLLEESKFEQNKIHLLGNGVVQDFIEQHSFFKELMPGSVSTIRITTVVDDDGIASMRACYLRIGRNFDSHVKSESHIRVPIKMETGELFEYGYLTNWFTIDKHPDTNILFAKKQIPNFAKCVTVALDLHKSVPFVRCIGWDMTVDKNNNVQVMEWNGTHNDIKFSEATQGPCFSDLGWEKLWKNK